MSSTIELEEHDKSMNSIMHLCLAVSEAHNNNSLNVMMDVE